LVGVAVNVTEVPEQIVVALAAIITLTGRFGFTAIVTVLDVAGLPVAHVAFEVSTHVTLFPLARAELVYVGESDPTLAPFTFHWYDGVVPSFTAVAVNVTDVPSQIVVALAAMLTLTGRFGFTVIVIPSEVTILGVAHPRLEVIVTVIISPSDNDVVVYVLLVSPDSGFPFFLHW